MENPILITDEIRLSQTYNPTPQTLQNRCPIQIVEDSYRDLWITLLANIAFKIIYFRNITKLSYGHTLVDFVDRLVNGKSNCYFMTGDIIRNPTIEEYEYIQQKLKQQGYIFNKKTNSFIKK